MRDLFDDDGDDKKSNDFAKMFEESLTGVEKKLAVGERVKVDHHRSLCGQDRKQEKQSETVQSHKEAGGRAGRSETSGEWKQIGCMGAVQLAKPESIICSIAINHATPWISGNHSPEVMIVPRQR